METFEDVCGKMGWAIPEVTGVAHSPNNLCRTSDVWTCCLFLSSQSHNLQPPPPPEPHWSEVDPAEPEVQ